MNDSQNAHLSMYNSVITYVDGSSAVWTGNVPFTTIFNKFKGKVVDLEALKQLQETSSEGSSEMKLNCRNSLIPKIEFINAAITAYGRATANGDLINKSKHPHSQLTKATDNDLYAWANDSFSLGDTNKVALATYGVTQLILDDFEDNITDFHALKSTPRDVIVQVRESTKEIKALIKEINLILKNELDVAVRLFTLSNPEFVSQYFMARTIVDGHTTTMALRGHVEDSETHLPLANINILITPGDISRTTPESGVFEVINLPEGNYEIHLDCPGFNPLVFPVVIVQGQTTDVTIPMVRM